MVCLVDVEDISEQRMEKMKKEKKKKMMMMKNYSVVVRW